MSMEVLQWRSNRDESRPAEPRGRVRLVMLVMAVLIMTLVCNFPEPRAMAGIKTVRVGFVLSIFEGKDVRDATAAVEVWAMQFAKDESIKKEMKSFVFETSEQLIAAIRQHKIDIAVLPAVDYLQTRPNNNLEPGMVTVKRGGYGDECVIVTHTGNGIQSVRNLHDKAIGSVRNARGMLFECWFRNLWKSEIAASPQDAPQWKSMQKEEQVLMSVFFRQIDAGLVSRDCLETSSELNPQLKRDIRMLRVSPRFITFLMCWAADLPEADKRELRDLGGRMDKSTAGKQILKLFQTEKMVEYSPDLLTPLQELGFGATKPHKAKQR
jgi:ABC-type phosphate/phosphonate transport system substrate-binding protein